jgi:glycerophosphoryl diester phosphodiesterase
MNNKFVMVCSAILMMMAACTTYATTWNYKEPKSTEEIRFELTKKYCQKNHCTTNVELGPRPFYLVEKMDNSGLKKRLQQCKHGPFYKTDFSIGHRGAPLQFPEHTKESYEAAARQGAGIMECDVTFTKDRALVCRHSQCDLHTTTNILATDLAKKCSEPFSPADPVSGKPATALCCTSDITLAEFKTLCGKMDAADAKATTLQAYLGGTADFRTDLYSTCGTLLSHKESIQLFQKLNVKFTPELKAPNVAMPFQGNYTQEMYAQQLINEYIEAGINPRNVWAQSFNVNDVLYWIKNNPRFGNQAVYLDARPYEDPSFLPSLADFEKLKAQGVEIVAPPMYVLLTLDAQNNIVPSNYAILARKAGLDIITWTIERSGRLIEDMKNGSGGTFYYSSILDAINNDCDMMKTLDVLAKDVGIIGIFSDWPATVTYYANCMGLN